MAGPPLLYVPARGGSEGVPGKNLQFVGGASLVGRAVMAARRWRREAGAAGARIFLDTDDPKIAKEGKHWGADVPFLRPARLAGGRVSTVDSVLHALDRLEREGQCYSSLVLLQPTSPFRSAQDIATCVNRYHIETAPSVISVVAAEHPVRLSLVMAHDGVVSWVDPPVSGVVRRQEYPVSYYPSGAVYVSSVALLRDQRSFVVHGRTVGVPGSRLSAVDIDTPDDLRFARLLVSARHCAAASPVRVRQISSEDRRYPIDGLAWALAELDNEVSKLPPAHVLEWPAEGALGLPEFLERLSIWQWATGARTGWLHDAKEPLVSYLAAAAGFDVIVRPGQEDVLSGRLVVGDQPSHSDGGPG